MVQDEDFYFKDGNILWLHDFSITNVNLYVYEYMQSNLFKKHINELSIGSTQKALTIQSLLSMKIIFPDIALIQKFGDMIKKVYNNIRIKRQENEKLKELQSVLLAKMGQ
jgi:type I restriction enzyme S subunit